MLKWFHQSKSIFPIEYENQNDKKEYWFKFYIPSHTLIDIDMKLCNILGFRPEEIIGENFQDTLLTPSLKRLTNELLKNSKKTISGLSEIGVKMNSLRWMPLLKKNKQIIWIKDFYPIIKFNSIIDSKKVFTVKVFFHIESNNLFAPNIPHGFMKYLTLHPTYYVKTFENCILIMMDVASSTKIAKTKNPAEVALMFHELIKISNEIINYNFYPFVRFIEACGDSLLFWHCPYYSYKHKNIHCECLHFACILSQKLNMFLRSNYDTYIRCGISCGQCGGGVWDGKTFRISGINVNLASRLESVCDEGYIVLSSDFYCNVCSEHEEMLNKYYIYERKHELNGIGNTKTYHVDIDEFEGDNENELLSFRNSYINLPYDI